MEDSAPNVATELVNSVETLDQIERRRNHPLYLQNSDTPGCVLTTVQLTGTENYSLWSRSMLINLRAKSKLGFVLGTCRRSEYKGEMEEQWEKCNAFVLAWIMNIVSRELLSSIVYATDAAVVWTDLKERFDKVDGSRGYQLHREIYTLSQGNMIVSAYFSKLRLLWDEFDALVPPPLCSCDKSRTYVDHLACLRLFAFLMGLNEVYAHARSQILMISPLPSVGKAYAMIMADESQRLTASSYTGSNMAEQIALYAGKGNFSKKFQSRRKNWDQTCDHCKIQGHVREECYRLNGYPPDWKFKKKSRVSSNLMQGNRHQDAVNHVTAKNEMELVDDFAPVGSMMKGKNTASSSGSGLNLSTQPTFTASQYNRILHMLERDEAGAISGKTSDNMTNMTGPLQWKGEGDW